MRGSSRILRRSPRSGKGNRRASSGRLHSEMERRAIDLTDDVYSGGKLVQIRGAECVALELNVGKGGGIRMIVGGRDGVAGYLKIQLVCSGAAELPKAFEAERLNRLR